MKKNKDPQRHVRSNQLYNICIIGVAEGEKGRETIFEEIMAEHFSDLMKIINLYIQAQQSPTRINARDPHTETS